MEKTSKLVGAFWIGSVETQSPQTIQMVYFNHNFQLEQRGQLTICVSAHTRYKLWINGEKVTVGPCKTSGITTIYEEVEVSHLLKKGENSILAQVVYYPHPVFEDSFSNSPFSVKSNTIGPWFILKGIIRDASDKVLYDLSTGIAPWSVVTDTSITWQNHNFLRFSCAGPYEVVDGSFIPINSNKTGIVGVSKPALTKWPADLDCFGELPVLPLEQRKIPLMYEVKKNFIKEMPVKACDDQHMTFSDNEKVVLEAGQKYVVELDAGELTTAYFTLRCLGGLGSRVKIIYCESYSEEQADGSFVRNRRDDAVHYDLNGYYDIFHPSGYEDHYEPFLFRTFRFVRIEIETKEHSLTLYKPTYLETGYPLKITSHITSSTEWINTLWEVSLRTLLRCMHETYEDCPYYEQLQYTLDTRLEGLYTYSVSSDTRLLLKAIDDFHASKLKDGILQSRSPSISLQVIPNFSLHWVLMVSEYYFQTKDMISVKKYRSTVDSILEWFEEHLNEEGLLDTIGQGYWNFVDWVPSWLNVRGEPDGTPQAARVGPSTTLNFLYAYTLEQASELMKLTGRTDTASEYRLRSQTLLSVIHEKCWDEEKQLYKEGPQIDEYTQHAQVWSILCNLKKDQDARDILHKSAEATEVSKCTYAYLFFVFRAYEQCGIYQETEKLWKPWIEAIDLGLTTWPEDFDFHKSDCHGWSALPLYEFTRCILGVRSITPGWEQVLIAPNCLSLMDAKGSVATPYGSIYVEWVRTETSFHIKGTLPEGIVTLLRLPDQTVHQINGQEFEYMIRNDSEPICMIL